MPPNTAEIFRLLAQIDDKVALAARIINQTLQGAHLVSIIVMKQIQDLWNRFIGMLNKLWENTKEVFQNLGDKDKLSDTAKAWSATVGRPVGGRAALSIEGELGVDDAVNWTGTAAEQYKQKLFPQRNAMEKIEQNFAKGISTVLNDMKSALTEFWVTLILGLIAFVAGICASFGLDGTVVLIPLGILAKIAATAVFIGAIGTAIFRLRSDADSAANTLGQTLSYVGFPDSFWPSATVD